MLMTAVRSRLAAWLLLMLLAFVMPPSDLKAKKSKSGSPEPAHVGPGLSGEPYALAGKRIVFTNWHYVRPGNFAWVNEKGENVGAKMKESHGDWGARFTSHDEPHGIRLVAQPAERRGPVVQREKPWEGNGIWVRTLLKEGDVYRMWTHSSSKDNMVYASILESRDGVAWERPKMDMVEFEGSRANNLIPSCPWFVFIDPTAPPEERYKGVENGGIKPEELEAYKKRRPDAWEPRSDRSKAGGSIYTLGGFVSPDGYRWTQLPEPLAVEHTDTQVTAYYDEQLKKYVVYTRNWSVGALAPDAPKGNDGTSWLNVGRRSIGRTESSDFRRFPVSTVIMEPAPDMLPNDLLYTNCRTTIPGAPDHHLMFPAIWNTGVDETQTVLASSHDGKLWNYVPGGPVLKTGNFGQFDGGCIFTSPNLVEFPNGDFALPYTGFRYPHKYPRGDWAFDPGLAVWPKGRMVALEAVDRGEFATVCFMPPGRKLRINAVTRRGGGKIQVEVAGLDYTALPGRSMAECDPIIGDQYRTPVTWKNDADLGFKEGQPIMLRFHMEKAQLFGLDFE